MHIKSGVRMMCLLEGRVREELWRVSRGGVQRRAKSESGSFMKSYLLCVINNTDQKVAFHMLVHVSIHYTFIIHVYIYTFHSTNIC